MDVRLTVAEFDRYLAQKGVRFEAVVIGGAALVVMGVVVRDTIDVDCLDPKIPEDVLRYAAEFRIARHELKLHEKWLNNGPDSLLRDLPDGWRSRVVSIFEGEAIRFFTLGRMDLLGTKLFAFCDRDQDLQDCLALKPTRGELDACFAWVADRDANPEWPENVRRHFAILKKRLGYGE